MRLTKLSFTLLILRSVLSAHSFSEQLGSDNTLFAIKELSDVHTDKLAIPTDSTNVIDIIFRTPNLSYFSELIRASGLSEPLKIEKEITVFAPDNSAFIPEVLQKIDKLKKEDKTDQLKEIVLNHVFNEKIRIAKNENQKIENLNGQTIEIEVKELEKKEAYAYEDRSFSSMVSSNEFQRVLNLPDKTKSRNKPNENNIFIGKAKLIDRKIVGRNGMIYTINAVLF